jgi:hypothetical protein
MTPCSSQCGVLPVMAMLAWCTISDTYKTITTNVLDDWINNQSELIGSTGAN